MMLKNAKCPAKKPSGELSLTTYFLTVMSKSEAVSYPQHQAVLVLLTWAASLNKVKLMPSLQLLCISSLSPTLYLGVLPISGK